MSSSPRYHTPLPPPDDGFDLSCDLCIYCANAAGVAAAVQAARLGLKVLLFNPARRTGGMSSSGLGFTDFGNKDAIGGLALEFHRRLGAHYGVEAEWRFEPHAAERVFDQMLAEVGVAPRHGHYLAAAETRGGRIVAARFDNGVRVRAACFIDASYEGDLMAAAGVSFVIGREGNLAHGETLNGAQVHDTHQFDRPVDPFVRPGDPTSGLLPGIEAGPEPVVGAGDHRVQAYNFRLCMTRDPAIRVPFPKPAGYDRRWYELLARHLAAGWDEVFWKFDRIRGAKTDTNNHGAVSSDFIGQNHAWPAASHAGRERIFQAHVTYQQGLWWFLANDPAVPPAIRAEAASWGHAGDEFTDTGHWPHQLYVREARRMLGEAVMTEAHCLSRVTCDDPIGLGAYTMDSHNCRRFVRDGRVLNEGDFQVRLPWPYGIGYGAITPRRGECANLLVPVCASATHVAYGSLRMEPVFMILAQSAAAAASLFLRDGLAAVQDVPYAELRRTLLANGQILEWDKAVPNGDPNESEALATG